MKNGLTLVKKRFLLLIARLEDTTIKILTFKQSCDLLATKGYAMPDVMTKKFLDKYGRSGSCGDTLSSSLSTYLVDPETGRTDTSKFKRVATDNGIDYSKWSHLNMGQRRMLLGNVLRGMLRRGAHVTVGNVTVTTN
jgi:hypothetical protein